MFKPRLLSTLLYVQYNNLILIFNSKQPSAIDDRSTSERVIVRHKFWCYGQKDRFS